MQKLLLRSVAFQLVTVCVFMTLLMGSMSACASFATPRSPTQELPSLQAIIPFTDPPRFPNFVSVIPGGYAYVAEENGAIIVMDRTELVTVIPLPPGEIGFGYRQAVAIHPQTNIGYLSNANTDNVYVIQGTEMITVLRKIGDGPVSVGVNRNTGLVYVGNSLDPLGITVLNGTEIVTRLVTSFPNVITPDPNSAKVYVGQTIIRSSPRKAQGMLAVVDTTTLVTLTNLNYEQDKPDSDGDINNIAIDRNSGEIYMIQNLGTVVYWHNGQIKRIKLGSMGYTGLHDIAIDPNRGLAYVSSWGEPSHVVVLKQGEFVTALPTGKDPRAVVFDETHDYVYVANRLGHSLSVIRATEVITTLDARGNPLDIGVDEERGYLYLANPDSHNITVFGFESEVNNPSLWQLFLPWLNQ